MLRTLADKILMIRPAHFGFNLETSLNNTFQSNDESLTPGQVAQKAIEEFDNMVQVLRENNIEVWVIEDTDLPEKTDAVFPNNWISFHQGGIVITYPMFSPNRRLERREDLIETLENKLGQLRRYSFEHYEEADQYLEGTGSMVLDREYKIAYACLSKRTDVRLLDKFCVLMGYKKSIFHAYDQNKIPIYHTNVMMSIGVDFVIICLDSVTDGEERNKLIEQFENTNKEIIELSSEQMNKFAGNMLQIKDKNGVPLLVASDQAVNSLTQSQLRKVEKHTNIISINIETIEKFGGGSVRCMMAEVFN